MTLEQLLDHAITSKASDLHLSVNMPPMLRVEGILSPVAGAPVLDSQAVKEMVFLLLSEDQKEIVLTNKELDFSVDFQGKGRFRANVYFQRGTLSAALRLLPLTIPGIQDLGLPEICRTFTKLKQGLVLVTGPTGHGKSTTLASILNEINTNRAAHIVTIEDPIEYILPLNRSIVSQRELRHDTHSWEIALRSCLREDPDVVMVGEMRDYETISAVLTVAETGHLVLSTLHTNSAAQTVDRIVDVFPEFQQEQIRMQLSLTLEAVFSQRLIPGIDGKRLPAAEIMIATPAVKTAIREGKTHLLDNIIQTSAELGMKTLEMDLARLVQGGKVDLDSARAFAVRPEDLMRLVRR